MTKQVNNQSSSVGPEPQWAEEWVHLESIIRHAPHQVRNKLDARAVHKYREMTNAGQEPPPIKAARVGETLYLVDGWHRMEAGAVQTMGRIDGGTDVLALVAEMTEQMARWEAARANMAHGVPLRSREYRNVFQAFIHAKQHIKPGGQRMSYREMGAALGKSHRTIHEWTHKDFPGLARALGGMEGGKGGLPEREAPPSLEEEHHQEARKALGQLVQHTQALSTPEARWNILEELEAAAVTLRAAGVRAPAPEDF